MAARLAGEAKTVAESRLGILEDVPPDVIFINVAPAHYLSSAIRFDAITCRDFTSIFGWARTLALPIGKFLCETPIYE